MKSGLFAVVTTTILAISAPAFAQPMPPQGGHGPQHGHMQQPAKPQPPAPNQRPPAPMSPAPHKAPPHAAKAPAPQFKKGERIRSGAQWLRNPERYRQLDRKKNYWTHNNYVYQVDPKTGKVLALIGLVSALTR